ncbi:MAG: serine/threonine protein kinase [Planctomycetaceae bacterium]|nr:serine/threonine protein kinase [Planctomycetaceae bacterium]
MSSAIYEHFCSRCYTKEGDAFGIRVKYSVHGDTVAAATRAMLDHIVRSAVFGSPQRSSIGLPATCEAVKQRLVQLLTTNAEMPQRFMLHAVEVEPSAESLEGNDRDLFTVDSAPEPESVKSTRRVQAAVAPATVSRDCQLDGFEFLEVLGKGAFGIVWLARELSLGRLKVIKTVRSGATDTVEQDALRRVTAVQHQNIVQVDRIVDVGGTTHFIMEYQTKQTLHTQIAGGRTFTMEAAVMIFWQLAAALEASHAVRVYHCDVKPKNVLYLDSGERPFVQLCDFGIARVLQARMQTPAADGTGGYRSPLSVSDDDRDLIANDIYSLAATMYSVFAARIRHSDSEPFEFACIPWILREPIRRALSLSPADRFSSVSAFVDAVNSAITVKLPICFDTAIRNGGIYSEIIQKAAAFVQYHQKYDEALTLLSAVPESAPIHDMKNWLSSVSSRIRILEDRLQGSLSADQLRFANEHLASLLQICPANTRFNNLVSWLATSPSSI